MAQFIKIFSRIAQVIFVPFLIYFAFRLCSYHFALVTFPFPCGLREGAMMVSTEALIKGLNPYAMSLQPQFMNQYGIIYPLLVWPFAKIFGITMLVHRAVTAFFILAICVLVYFVLRRMYVPILLNIWAVLMLYSSLLYPVTSTPSVDPGATGMFFFLLTVFIPWFYKYSSRSLLISIICGLLAFYTKPYTLLGLPVMLSFLFLFVSKSKGLFYSVFLLILSVISVMVVNQLFPAYFDNCFFSHVNMESGWSSMERLYLQINMYSRIHKWTLILMGLFILGYLFKSIYYNSRDIKKNMAQVFSSLRLKGFNEPLIKLQFPLVVYAALCSAFVLYISLGRHSGAMLWYFFQLLSPFLLICAVWLFSRSSYWPVLCIPLLVLNLYSITFEENYKIFDKKMSGWTEVSELIGHYQSILNSPLIAPLLIEQGKEIIDDGQAEYFLPGGERTSWMKGLFKEDERVSIQMALFFENIKERVDRQDFDMIILQPSLLPMGVADEIKKYYKFEGQALLYAPQDQRPYAITIWVPLK